ncbi:carbon-monoxide dehydrogenase medium subunit [Sulfodiicoccus acidiphilus]|uniref:Carbon-monoxide dehydrogenase medium subunit n=1 Tax=Sulfodiicoccus acidiphilus TaxID=1670455 RepID=A0A348B1L0_9CREN|nr:carbon-monoxide dehydrogenase medium subunit [Sulfodiicoccus acidiphilus]GGU00052.1 carbon-monoxide dehydrogenase medium subunit [Sulfodiicoccus acidiphilus]
MEILSKDEDSKAMAGGQSLLPMMKLRIIGPSTIVSLSKVAELKPHVTVSGETVKIGALTTHDAVNRSPDLKRYAPLLSEAAGHIADQQIRNRGTIGGNISHGDPACNMATALTALDATVHVTGPEGKRTIPIRDFFVDTLVTSLRQGEVVTDVEVPVARPGTKQKFVKISKTATSWPMAMVGVSVELSPERKVERVSIALGVAANTPVRATKAEEYLIGKVLTEEVVKVAGDVATDGLTPPSDLHASSEYRRQLLRVLVRRALSTVGEVS